MNASDIVKSKQNKVLYKAFYDPYIYASSIFSTITIVSSIVGNDNSSISSSYTSSISTCYTYTCNPTFISYEMAKNIENGKYACGAKSISNTQWKNTNNTVVYAYNAIYAQNPIAIDVINTIDTESTIIKTAPGPTICPTISVVNYNQSR